MFILAKFLLVVYLFAKEHVQGILKYIVMNLDFKLNFTTFGLTNCFLECRRCLGTALPMMSAKSSASSPGENCCMCILPL
jgi:hypothetical protein